MHLITQNHSANPSAPLGKQNNLGGTLKALGHHKKLISYGIVYNSECPIRKLFLWGTRKIDVLWGALGRRASECPIRNWVVWFSYGNLSAKRTVQSAPYDAISECPIRPLRQIRVFSYGIKIANLAILNSREASFKWAFVVISTSFR